MSKRSIIILIICTAIIIAVSVFTLRKDPGITKIYLSSTGAAGEFGNNSESESTRFQSENSDIYLLILVRDLTTDDNIEIEWFFTGDNKETIIQQDFIKPENDGSGEIVVYLLKKDDMYSPGTYMVKVDLKNIQELQKEFVVNKE